MKFEDFSSSGSLSVAGESKHLTESEKHLLGLAVTMTRGCIKCTGSRIQKAREAGIADSALVAAIDLAAAVNAGVTLAIAIQGEELFTQTPVLRESECVDGACVVGLG